MLFAVLDIEADGLLKEVTKLHCLCYTILDENLNEIRKGDIFTKEEILELLDEVDYIVCHNYVVYDGPVLKKLFDIQVPKYKIIDTLSISYYLFPHFDKHGLDAWGERVGIKKPKIEDWKNLTQEEYVFRCQEDVKINVSIFIGMFSYLKELYDNDLERVFILINYLTFKMDCLREHEYIKIKLNVELATKHRDDLLVIFEENTKELSNIMPKELGKLVKTKPAKMFKKDGSISSIGMKWIEYLRENNLPADTEEVREAPNPGSDTQLKKWLFSLGWKPITFKVSKGVKTNGEKIPQVNLPFGQGLCPSVKDLYEVEPNLEILEMYYKIRHRIGIFNGYLDSVDEDGFLYCRAHGFTNTLRLTHSKPIANLPKPGVFYGTECREVLTIPNTDDYIMIGSDISGLEDNTKQHYIYFYDPEYVKEMRVPGFDPHIDIGVLAGFISKEEEEFFKWAEAQKNLSDEDKAKLKPIKKKRGTAKSTNFSATYGAGGPKIAETAKVSLEEGMKLHAIYWKRNWAVKQIAEDCTVKVVRGQKWLYNPLSGFWLFLKAEKDRFSTLNQNSGVFVFDNWLYQVRERLNELGIYVCLQYHDELLVWCKKEHEETVVKLLKESMAVVNEIIKLNIEINISIDVGTNYAECH